MASPPPPGPYGNGYADHGISYQPDEQWQTSMTPPPPAPPSHRNHPAAHPSSAFNQMQSERQYGVPPSPQRASPPRSIMTQGYPVSHRSVSPPQYDQDEIDRGMDHGPSQEGRMPVLSQGSSSSVLPLAAAGYAPGQMTPHSNYSGPTLHPDDMPQMGRSMNNYNMPPYQQRQSWYDNPYDAHSISRAPAGMSDIDPNAIADDGDDGLEYSAQRPQRKSMLGFGRDTNSRSSMNAVPAGAAGAAAGAGAGALASGSAAAPTAGGGMFANLGTRDASGNYAPVPGGGAPGSAGGGVGGGSNPFDGGAAKEANSDWLASQNKGRKKMRWIIGSIIVVVIIAAIVGGTVGGILGSRKNKSSSGGSSGDSSGTGGGESAAEDDGKGDLNKDSSEIQALMNNKNLHRVFPGIDYSPLNTQYPACLTNPPSQNNVTRDMAVLGQLTNTIRLYGTDCNQTEMVLHSISQLQLTDMKVWLGVWVGNNDTTNKRQMSDMWTLLDKYGKDPFVGVAVGNEVLFRKDQTVTALGNMLTSVKKNLTSNNIDLPVATSDLGSSWSENPQLVDDVDVVMSNVHPFFAGTPVDQAAGWTWDFWQNNDIAVAKTKTNIISEVGWPSAGGNDCGTTVPVCPDKTSGSVAGISEMNQFMNDWVCQSLANNTNYFWFEAFDEPWKNSLNSPSKGQMWEDKWGLMDVDRNLKDGVTIPDCGGKTIPSH